MAKLNILLVTLALLACAGQILSAPSRYQDCTYPHIAKGIHHILLSELPGTPPPMKGVLEVQEVPGAVQEAEQGARGRNPGGVTRSR